VSQSLGRGSVDPGEICRYHGEGGLRLEAARRDDVSRLPSSLPHVVAHCPGQLEETLVEVQVA
jgi:hypothetical protein